MNFIHLLTRKLASFMPVVFFFGGFVWDALTIGHNVVPLDLYIFAFYLVSAGAILYWIGRPSAEATASNRVMQAYSRY